MREVVDVQQNHRAHQLLGAVGDGRAVQHAGQPVMGGFVLWRRASLPRRALSWFISACAGRTG